MKIILGKHNRCSQLYAYDIGELILPDGICSGDYAIVENSHGGYDLVRIVMIGEINDNFQGILTRKGDIISKVLLCFTADAMKSMQEFQHRTEGDDSNPPRRLDTPVGVSVDELQKKTRSVAYETGFSDGYSAGLEDKKIVDRAFERGD